MPEAWRKLGSRRLHDSHWISLRQDQVELPSGIVLDDYYVVEQHDFVKVFAYTASHDVIFVRQYKHGIGRVILELPAGFIERGEDPAAAADRELREETGYRAARLELAAEWVVDPTRTATTEYLFFGQAEFEGAQELDRTEDIEVVLIPADEVPGLIERGELTAVTSVAAALHCLPRLKGSAS